MAALNDLRASDAERDEVADLLRTALVEGRLTQDEFDDRVGRALSAKTVGELVPITADLPPKPSGPLVGSTVAPRDASPGSTVLERARDRLPGTLDSAFGGWLAIFAVSSAVWLITGLTSGFGDFWPGWLLLWGFFTLRHGAPGRHGRGRGHHHSDRRAPIERPDRRRDRRQL